VKGDLAISNAIRHQLPRLNKEPKQVARALANQQRVGQASKQMHARRLVSPPRIRTTGPRHRKNLAKANNRQRVREILTRRVPTVKAKPVKARHRPIVLQIRVKRPADSNKEFQRVLKQGPARIPPHPDVLNLIKVREAETILRVQASGLAVTRPPARPV